MNDLQAWWRSKKDVVETLQLLPEMPEPIVIDQAIAQVASHGRVNHVANPRSMAKVLIFKRYFVAPLPVTALWKPATGAAGAAARAAGLNYRDFLSVVLIVDRAEVFPDNWIYIHSPEVKMGRIQNYKNWRPHMVPGPSMTALGLEYLL